MDSPIQTVKSNLTVTKVLGFTVVALVVFAIADFTGLTGWVLYPVSTIKAKLNANKQKAA